MNRILLLTLGLLLVMLPIIPLALSQVKIEPVDTSIDTTVDNEDKVLPVTPENIEKTISDTDTRKSFGYCPINGDTKAILDKLGLTYSVESCPMSRIYIDNWDKLDMITKNEIVNQLIAKGYRMETE